MTTEEQIKKLKEEWEELRNKQHDIAEKIIHLEDGMNGGRNADIINRITANKGKYMVLGIGQDHYCLRPSKVTIKNNIVMVTPVQNSTVYRVNYYKDKIEWLSVSPSCCEYMFNPETVLQGDSKETIKDIIKFLDKSLNLINGKGSNS